MEGSFEEHIRHRCGAMSDEILSRFANYEDELLIFTLWNLSGQFLGTQTYNWRGDKNISNGEGGRYWTWLKGDQRTAWGFEYLSLQKSKELFITEGVFDAISIMNCGYNAIAALTNAPVHIKNLLFALPYKTIAICDGDEAGSLLADVTDEYIVLPSGEDANSLSLDRLSDILK